MESVADTWDAFIDEAADRFRDASKDWERDFLSLRGAWDEVPQQPPPDSVGAERAKANSIRYQIRANCDITVIEFFSDAGFLPRYGFPIHLQRLSVRKPREDQPDKSTTAEGYRLERQSLLALSEYVPGAQVLVGGKVAESKGILKHWTEANKDEALGLNYWAMTCASGHEYLGTSQDEACPECGEAAQAKRDQLMFPRFGYTTAAWDPPKPPGRNLDRVGKVLTTATGFSLSAVTNEQSDFGNVRGLTALYYEAGQGELLIRNAGDDNHGFALCTRCGFAMSEEKARKANGPAPDLPREFRDHASVFSTKVNTRCWGKNLGSEPVLRHKVLAARETTDVLILDWPSDAGQGPLFSLGRALVLAGARLLEVDSREIGLLEPRPAEEFTILLHDTVPGGAGHCFELFRLGRQWLEEARRILWVTASHNNACERACLECLLDFGGQFNAHLLDRKGALELLAEAIN